MHDSTKQLVYKITLISEVLSAPWTIGVFKSPAGSMGTFNLSSFSFSKYCCEQKVLQKIEMQQEPLIRGVKEHFYERLNGRDIQYFLSKC